ADNGYACGTEFVYWTDDGGENWTAGIGDFDRTFYGLAIWGDTLLAVGDNGAIRRSTDGGVNWTNIDSGSNNRLYSVSFGDASNAWAVGTGGTILYSDDSGLTWVEQTSTFQLELFRVEFLDNQVGYAACYNQTVLKTIDGGSSWTIVCSEDDSLIRLHALDVLDAETFWIGGGDPPLAYYSTDSGEHLIGGEIDLSEDLAWRNVVCELHAEDDTEPALLLTAHYDSISEDPFNLAPGADDNGSGTTALLTVARAFYDQTFATPVRLVFFSGEEQGLIGSSYYVDEMIATGEVGGVINLDMYAYRDDDEMDLQAYTENSSLWLSEVYKESVEGHSNATVVETNDPSFQRSDHASFWRAGIPAIQVGEYPGTEWYPYYHTTEDTIQYVNMEQALAGATGAAAAVMTLVPHVESGHETADIYTYPNPFRPYRGDETIIFRNLPAGATLSIFDISGALVYETVVSGEPFTWGAVNQAGIELASGVYLYHVKTADTTEIGKLAIVR
ncbi:M20/M25/M40 family metallo-hydrolase, partial [bacterium]|nr:M20/M25/M40 family metallo-hydrolase [bacterium]